MEGPYVTGSQATQEIVSQAIRPGTKRWRRTIAAPPYHAVPLVQLEGDDIDRTAACGEMMRHAFKDDPWERGLGSSADRCPRCRELTGLS